MATFDVIKNGMALAFFASAYAELCDEAGQSLRGQIMDQLPTPIDPAAIQAADTLINKMVGAHDFGEPGLNERQKIMCLYLKVSRLDKEGADRELTAELFGHYCAMQAMGTGVGLESFGYAARDAVSVPHVDFGSGDLNPSDYGFDESE